jgi:Metallo-peptidase family M12/IPT/TIG domain
MASNRMNAASAPPMLMGLSPKGRWWPSVFLVLLLAGGLNAVAAEAPGSGLSVLPGLIVDRPSGPGELVTFEPALVSALLAVPPEGRLRIESWPVAAGERRAVVLTRHEVYAPDARIVAIDNGREVEVPWSRLDFFSGAAEGDASVVVFLSADPDTGSLRGYVHSAMGSNELGPAGDAAGRHLLAPPAVRADGTLPQWTCGQEARPPGAARPLARAPQAGVTPALSSLYTATLAIDTDNELLQVKFLNDTTLTVNYIASLLASINVMYERDLNLRLLQGTTILRLSTTADPYTGDGSAADGTKLDEFTNYWRSHYPQVKRAAVAMLSGKQSGGFASGIAWVSGLCDTTYTYTYSFSQVFGDWLTGDTQVVGHEIGHNLGSPHTHCYTPPLDTCYNGESCYTGPTSCPIPTTMSGLPNVKGTLMSYCHTLSGCGVTNVFHPGTVSYLSPFLQSAASSCIFPVGTAAPTVTSASIPSGPATGGTVLTVTGTNFQPAASVALVDLVGSTAPASVSFVNAASLTVTMPAHAAGAVDVVVMNPDQQTATLKNGFTFTSSQPAPTVTAVAPNSGSTLGSTPVTITGTGFVPGATVSLGGSAASSVNVANSTTITALTGAHTTGTVNVLVTNPDAQAGTLTNGYFYVPPATSAAFHVVAPCRLLDTRNPNGPLGGPALAGGGARRLFALAGNCGVPAGAKAVSVNVTVTQPAASGSLTLYPGNGTPTGASAISFAAGQTRANNALLYLATDGTGGFGVQNAAAGSVHFILDVNGYFQ